MASVFYATHQHQQQSSQAQTAVKQDANPNNSPNRHEITFVPMLVDLETPIRKIIKAMQWRRQWVDFLGSIVSGAVSLR